MYADSSDGLAGDVVEAREMFAVELLRPALLNTSSALSAEATLLAFLPAV
jgi:hypothetical protein